MRTAGSRGHGGEGPRADALPQQPLRTLNNLEPYGLGFRVQGLGFLCHKGSSDDAGVSESNEGSMV